MPYHTRPRRDARWERGKVYASIAGGLLVGGLAAWGADHAIQGHAFEAWRGLCDIAAFLGAGYFSAKMINGGINTFQDEVYDMQRDRREDMREELDEEMTFRTGTNARLPAGVRQLNILPPRYRRQID